MRSRSPSHAASVMKAFWDGRARDDAHFYIATWTGYRRQRTEAYFESPQSIEALLRSHGVAPNSGHRMLEIGCGIGRMTRGFAALFGEVDAVDVSAEMVTRARANLSSFENVRVHETNGLDLALFADHTFDLCFSYIVFQHLPSFEITLGYMREAARVLKPGGDFLFQVNNAPPEREYSIWPLRALSRLWRRHGWHNVLLLRAVLTRGPRGFDHPAWMGHRVTVSQVNTGLADAGLEVRWMSGQGTPYLWVRAVKPLS